MWDKIINTNNLLAFQLGIGIGLFIGGLIVIIAYNLHDFIEDHLDKGDDDN